MIPSFKRLLLTLLVLPLLLLTLLSSCSRAGSQIVYHFFDEGSNVLGYQFDMTDSSRTYDISFYSRIDVSMSALDTLKGVELEILLTSPSGRLAYETVAIPRSDFDPEGTGGYQFCKEYRKGIVPSEYGRWNMQVRVSKVKGMEGLGIIVQPN